MRTPVLSSLLLALCLASPLGARQSLPRTDFVFLVDNSLSMDTHIQRVRAGVSAFAQLLAANQIDARFALVTFGCRPKLVLDLTSDAALLEARMQAVVANQGSPEAGLEAIRMALGVAPQVFQQPPAGSDGRLHFRQGALVNLILITDEDSDIPFHPANRFPGQPDPPCVANCSTGTNCGNPPSPAADSWNAWQAEIDATASAVLAQGAYVNLVIDSGQGQSLFQYGSQFVTQLDAQGNFDRASTFASMSDLQKRSLQGRVLANGGLARAFQISLMNFDLDNDGISDLVEQLFATKVQETLLANEAPIFVSGPAATCGLGGTPLVAEVGQPLQLSVQATAPEIQQSTVITLDAGAPANLSFSSSPGTTATAHLTFVPDATQAGLHTIRLIATDDGLPQLSTAMEICIQVGAPVIQATCFGHVGCPCGNDVGPGVLTGCANSTPGGDGASLSWSGGASLAAANLDVQLSGLPKRTFSILFAGSAATSVPFGQGLACVSPGPQKGPSPPWSFGLVRLGGGASQGGLLAVNGVVQGLEQALGPLAAGQTVHLQGYYRNPAFVCPNSPAATFNFTNALTVTFEP